MYKATNLLSSSSSPTQGDLRLTFLGMMASLKRYQNTMANAIYNKLEFYWNRHLSESSAISAILDPRYKLSTFVDLQERNNYINHLKTLFSSYMSNFNITPNRINRNTLQDSRNYFLNMINNDQNSFVDNLDCDEINNYLNTPNEMDTDPLLWWKVHQQEYPILSSIAKDYLIIQATSVPSEQAFSIAGNMISQTRNQLNSDTSRAILCLKSWIENDIGAELYISSYNNIDDYDDDDSDYSNNSSDGSGNSNNVSSSSNSDDSSSNSSSDNES
jgi:hypothetical protein